MIPVTPHIALDEAEIQERFVRASGPGGQHVNKTSSAVELRFDVWRSPSLSDEVKIRLARLAGSRLTQDGVIVLFAQTHSAQQRNRDEALDRLLHLIRQAAIPPQAPPPHQTNAGRQAATAGKQDASVGGEVRAGEAGGGGLRIMREAACRYL